MAVVKIDESGAVVQRWLDVAYLPDFEQKYNLYGPEYIEGNPADGYTYVEGEWVPPAPPTPEEALAEWRAQASCTRSQGKLALGPEVWAVVLEMLDDPDTPWGLIIAIEDTTTWYRTDEDMAALIWVMNLTEIEADDLFRLAVTL